MSVTTTSPTRWLPSAGDGIQLVPSASAWTFGSWVELTSSAPTDLYPQYVAILPHDGGLEPDLDCEIEIGTGAAAAETTRITMRVRVMGNQWGPMSTVPLGVLYRHIASGTRVAMRVRHSAAATVGAYRCALGYLATLGGATGWSQGQPTAVPSGSSTISVAGTTAWANGAWTEALAAASVTQPLLLTGIVASAWTIAGEIQIGFGSSGSEVVKLTLPYGSGTGEGMGYARLPRRLYVPAGTRVAVRQRANTSDAFNATIWYVAA